ncbi:MAG: phosphorylase [Acinetobacter sp.]
MLKILLIEDMVDKKANVVQFLHQAFNAELHDIQYATDASTAKRLLSAHFFDLVIVDLNIPRRDVTSSERNVGIEVIQFIENNPRAISPKFIACLTAYQIDPEFIRNYPLCHFIQYSISDNSWKDSLSKICSYLSRIHAPPLRKDKITFHTDILIVTAIDEEFAAVKKYLKIEEQWQTTRINGDDQKYATALVQTEYGVLSVILTQAVQMGMAAAAVCATKAIEYFAPQCVIMSGICAGVKNKTQLGDIIISDPSFDCGSGKWKVDEEGDLIFHPAHYQLRVESEVKRICDEIADDRSMPGKIFAEFTEQALRPSYHPKIIVGVNASGGSVLQSTIKMTEIVETHKNLIGLEMEVYAVYLAATHSRQPKPKFIAAKSVCDFGTEDKADAFHEYASYTSVAFINEFLSKADFLEENLVNKALAEATE